MRGRSAVRVGDPTLCVFAMLAISYILAGQKWEWGVGCDDCNQDIDRKRLERWCPETFIFAPFQRP